METDDYKYETNGDPSKCEECGGDMTWCEGCGVWSRTCCVAYGTCMCS